MIKLKIEGMTCGHCVMAVNEALAAVPGVTGPVAVSLDPGEARVEGTPDPQALLAAVAEEGFTAVVVA
jgi:copper chaperone